MFSAAASTRLDDVADPEDPARHPLGWNTLSCVSFSPSPMNFTGNPVTERMDNAAPPRASPSTRVKTIPVRPTAAWKVLATSTACCPVAESRDQENLPGS